MRKLILSVSVSLDGYVEGPKADMSWIATENNDEWDNLFESLYKVDLYILGAGMWAGYRDHWKQMLVDANAPANELKYARLADKTRHIVFSKTLKNSGWKNTVINSGNVTAEVKRLKEQPGQDIMTYGGAAFAATLIDSGLIDEYRLVMNPVILAGGKSLFGQLTNNRKLQLVNLKKLGQLAVLTYQQLSNGA